MRNDQVCDTFLICLIASIPDPLLFLAVADALSFRQAAETLHLSQPPLSRAIRELEERLGTRLFDRNTRGVTLTVAGEKLLPYARSIAKLLREAEAALTIGGLPPDLRLD